MLRADKLIQNRIKIDGKWVAAKPLIQPLKFRIKDAWKVIKGEAEAVTFYKQ